MPVWPILIYTAQRTTPKINYGVNITKINNNQTLQKLTRHITKLFSNGKTTDSKLGTSTTYFPTRYIYLGTFPFLKKMVVAESISYINF